MSLGEIILGIVTALITALSVILGYIAKKKTKNAEASLESETVANKEADLAIKAKEALEHLQDILTVKLPQAMAVIENANISGSEKKQYVTTLIQAEATKFGISIDANLLSGLIEGFINFSKVVNCKGYEAKTEEIKPTQNLFSVSDNGYTQALENRQKAVVVINENFDTEIKINETENVSDNEEDYKNKMAELAEKLGG